MVLDVQVAVEADAVQNVQELVLLAVKGVN